jgi:hypothetical protein
MALATLIIEATRFLPPVFWPQRTDFNIPTVVGTIRYSSALTVTPDTLLRLKRNEPGYSRGYVDRWGSGFDSRQRHEFCFRQCQTTLQRPLQSACCVSCRVIYTQKPTNIGQKQHFLLKRNFSSGPKHVAAVTFLINKCYFLWIFLVSLSCPMDKLAVFSQRLSALEPDFEPHTAISCVVFKNTRICISICWCNLRCWRVISEMM